MNLIYGAKRPKGCGPKRCRAEWQEWVQDIEEGAEKYLADEDAWKHDFEKEPAESDFDCEASYLSKRVFELFLRAEGCEARDPQTHPLDGDEKIFEDRRLKLNDRSDRGFYFDIMNNPKPRHNDETRLSFAWLKAVKFYGIYHTIGNFGLLPGWLQDDARSLNFVHNDYGDRWDAFLQYGLFERFRQSDQSVMGLKRYIQLNCMYQYILKCPELESGWREPGFSWEGQVAAWKEWLDALPDDKIVVASVIDGKRLEDSWEEEKGRPGKLEDAERDAMDDRICTLIEVRGRCITAVARHMAKGE